jgi:hypothetical protein
LSSGVDASFRGVDASSRHPRLSSTCTTRSSFASRSRFPRP